MKITLSGLFEVKPHQFTYKDTDLHELFEIAKTVGFDGIDYMVTIPDLLKKPRKVLELSKSYQFSVLDLHAPLHLLLYTPPIMIPRLLKSFSYFPDATVYNFHLSGFIHPLYHSDKNALKFFQKAKEKKVPVSFESNPLLMGMGKYPKVTYDPDLFGEFCVKNNMPITFDTAHVAHCGTDIVDFFRKYHAHIKLIHLSDAIGSIQHLPLGKGNLPIVALLKEIKKLHYDESITFEICNYDKKATMKQKLAAITESFAMVQQYAL